ncbi:unnamed protein product [Triticum turgidum subsp. durum]|uniref:Uncharacterized protein n=1 Tax=Triticum turgidum subsp. durum TaxID=4567 RepID=A0A9R1PST6_TRITD|nr:unnamed protein product [Triticum turgidum subsp. durum]
MWCASCLASACAGCACNLCTSAAASVTRRSARLAYCGLFAASLILSFLLRQFAAPLLQHIPCIVSLLFVPLIADETTLVAIGTWYICGTR